LIKTGILNKEVENRLKTLFPFLLELPEKTYRTIINSGRYETAHIGETLMEEGRVCLGIALVMSGSIRIYKISETGREVTLYRIRPGETCVLAASCMLGGMTFPIIAEAEQETELFMIPKQTFETEFARSSVMQRFIFRQNAEKLVDIISVLDDIAFERIDKRLIRYLLANGDTLKTTHEKIAMELGTAREVVSRLLKDFENQGLVGLRRGSVKIKKRRQLENFLP